ncbi:MAG TPA: aldehyde dehydrogenase family protein, partial [Candidatus Acidoferrales bacterium]|nr:aldehyde dehydrogenase family protein [Candidatus Acidoferrales bacterium]
MNVQLTPNVSKFLGAPIQHFIGGRFTPGDNGTTSQVLNPSDGSILATVAMGSTKEVDEAVAAAWKAFPAWSALSPNERAARLHRFAEQLEKHSADLALLESLDVGKAITAAEAFDVPFGIQGL